MMQTTKFMLNCEEAAVVCALRAERVLDKAPDGLLNRTIIPPSVSLLFKSLEMSIRCAIVESGVVAYTETIGPKMHDEHGIEELVKLAAKRLKVKPSVIAEAMTHKIKSYSEKDMIEDMIYSRAFEKLRIAYAKNCLGSAELCNLKGGSFSTISDVKVWIEVVKKTAEKLPMTVGVFSDMKKRLSPTGRSKS